MKSKVPQEKKENVSRLTTQQSEGQTCKSLKSDDSSKQINTIENSSLQSIQQKRMDSLFGGTLQRDAELEEEPVQQKVVQRELNPEEEAPVQEKAMGKLGQLKIEDEEAPLQGKMMDSVPAQLMLGDDEEEAAVQSKSNPAQRQENTTGMPDGVKQKMESSFNADFSDVKVHSESSKAPEVGALAYTQGSDVHFAPGQFKPESSAGQQLIGHELAHVVQQREGRVQPTTEIAGMPVNDNASLENEADALGAKASN